MDTVSGSATEGEYITLKDYPNLDAIPGLAVRLDGSVYTFRADAGGALIGLDPLTADSMLVFDGLNEGSQGKGTTFGNDGLLYVSGRSELSVIDVDAQTIDTIGAFTYTGFPTLVDATPTIGSMATRVSDGTVFGILKDGGGGNGQNATYLVTINLATAELTNVGVTGELLDGLAYIPRALVEAREP